MITAKIRNFRGIREADIEIGSIALIAGKNHQGKSSICQAVAAALTNSPIPFFRAAKPDSASFTKEQAKGLVTDATKEGSGVRVETDPKNRIMIAWPGLTVKIDGKPPSASKIACWLVNPIEMPEDARAKFYSVLFKADPAKADFIAALAASGYDVEGNEKKVAALWDSIEISGWDALHAKVREEATKLKGQWERVSGTRYGAEKAETFAPADWDDETAAATADALDEAVAKAKQRVEDLTAGAAVGEAALDALEEKAKREADILTKRPAAKKALDEARVAFQKAEAELAPLRMPHVYPCKHCGGMNKITINLDGTFVVEQSDLTDADIAKMAAAREVARKQHEAANAALGTASDAWNALRTSYEQVAGSGEQLVAAKAKTGNVEELLAAKEELSARQKRYAAKRVHEDCKALHEQVKANQIVIDVLAVTGLRQTKLQEKLAVFNKVLEGYCGEADYQPVSVTPDLDVTLGGRPYVLLSDSEKYRCRAIIQIAAAVYEGSNIVILDGADILDGPGRNGLFNLLGTLGGSFHALIAMTYGKQALVPDMTKAGLGKTYWIEGGKCSELNQKGK